MSDSALVVTLSDRLRAQVERAAEAEDTSPAAWIERAIARQLDDREWRGLLAYGEQRAAALDVTEADVERLIAESRAERRASGAPSAGT